MTAHRRVSEDRVDEAAELRRRIDERRADRWFRLERMYNGPIPAHLRKWANEGAETIDGKHS